MKKALLLIIAVVSVLQAYAQNADSMQAQSAAATIDSLSLRLEKLQYDYDFMSCDYQLKKLEWGLTNLKQDINIMANEILIRVFNTRYDRSLYTAFIEGYNSNSALFDTIKESFESIKTWVMLKVVSSNFSDTELNVISSDIDIIKHGISAVDTALNHLDICIQGYRDKR